MKIRLYHASPRRYRRGEVIRPSGAGSLRPWQKPWTGVFCTTRPEPHYTVAPTAWAEGWHVYEIRPIGRIAFGPEWDEVQVEAAEVVRYVGTARGLMRLHKRRKFRGSRVWRREVAALRRRHVQ